MLGARTNKIIKKDNLNLIAVLMTLWWSRRMRVKVRSDWNWSAYLFSTDWNRSMSPERIAWREQEMLKNRVIWKKNCRLYYCYTYINCWKERSLKKNVQLTLGQFEVGSERGFVSLDEEEVSLGNSSEQQLDGHAQLVNRLTEPDRGRRSLTQCLSQVLARFGVVQLKLKKLN